MLVLLLIIAAFGFVFLGGFAGAATAIVGVVLVGLVVVVVGVVVAMVSRAVDDWKQYGWRRNGWRRRYAPAPPSKGAYAIGVIYLSGIRVVALLLVVQWMTGLTVEHPRAVAGEGTLPAWAIGACVVVGYAVSVALAVRL